MVTYHVSSVTIFNLICYLNLIIIKHYFVYLFTYLGENLCFIVHIYGSENNFLFSHLLRPRDRTGFQAWQKVFLHAEPSTWPTKHYSEKPSEAYTVLLNNFFTELVG